MKGSYDWYDLSIGNSSGDDLRKQIGNCKQRSVGSNQYFGLGDDYYGTDYFRSNRDIVSFTLLSFDPEVGLLSLLTVPPRFSFLSFPSFATFLWSSASPKGFFKLVSEVSGV